MGRDGSIAIAVTVHFLLCIRSIEDLLRFGLNFPHLMIVAAVALFLRDNDVFNEKYKVHGKWMHNVMEVIVCWMTIEFSVWMVWGIFESIVMHILRKLLVGKWLRLWRSLISEMVLCGFGISFLMYTMKATGMDGSFCEVMKICRKKIPENGTNSNSAEKSTVKVMTPRESRTSVAGFKTSNLASKSSCGGKSLRSRSRQTVN